MFKLFCEVIFVFYSLDLFLVYRDIKVGRVCIIDYGLYIRLSYI